MAADPPKPGGLALAGAGRARLWRAIARVWSFAARTFPRRLLPGLDLLAVLGLAALTWIFYSAILRLWWTNDDAFHLHYILSHSAVAYCTAPEVWRQLPFRMLTPLLFLSMHLDLSIFGLSPRGFYGHQLLALAGAAGGFYCLLRLWLSRFLALTGGVLLLLGPPVATSVGLIMDRHYLEGLCWSIASAGTFVWSLRSGRGRRSLAVLSALLYLLASLEKEVFVPLPAILLVIPEAGWRERARHAVPHLVGLGVYTAYRFFMLGVFFGGYGWTITPEGMLRLAAALPGKMLADLAGGQASGWCALGLLAIGGVAGLLLRRAGRLAAAFGMAGAVLPVLPVSTHLQVRYALVAWLVVVVLFVFGCHALAHQGRRQGRALATGLAFVTCVAVAVAARAEWVKSFGDQARMSEENRFFLAMPAGSLLRQPLGPGASFAELRWLKEDYFKRPAGAKWSYDDLDLCVPRPVEGVRVWSYDTAARGMAEVTGQLPRICAAYRRNVRPNAPLDARFDWRGDDLFWRLGPFDEGVYSLLIGDGAGVLPVPREYGHQTAGAQALALRVRYESPEGWITYSPSFHLDRAARPSIAWRRGSFPARPAGR